MRRFGGTWHGNRYSGNENSSTFRLTRSSRLKPKRKAASSAVTARLPETYQWLLVPVQARPDASMEWQATRLSGQHSLAARASKKLKGDELLVDRLLPPLGLRMELDRVPLWRGDHVSIKQIADDFARYLYLPRVSGPTVLLNAISDGIALLTWEQDAYAFADSFDDEAKRYLGFAWRASRFHYRMRMLLGCSSSRISRVNSLMPKVHSRLSSGEGAGRRNGWREYGPRQRDPVQLSVLRVHHQHRNRSGFMGPRR